MIKEISFKKNSKTNERINNSVEIDTVIVQPSSLRIELLQHVEYFNEKLNNTNINIINDVPFADWIPVDRWVDLICVSKKFKTVFENKLQGYWYPTNNENYFIFLLNNCINALDEEKTIIINNKERVYWYESIENETFIPQIENHEYLFTVPQEPFRKLSTTNFEKLYRDNNLTGIQFYKELNFKRVTGSKFDVLRLNQYDDEGNCLE